MAGSADDLQRIECPACGGMNPPDAARCQFCGEVLDGPGLISRGDAYEDDDPLADLREHFEEEIDRSRKPTNPLRKPQTDFKLGQGRRVEDAPQEEDAPPGDEPWPEWLPKPGEGEPPPGEESAGGGIPDWLNEYGADPETLPGPGESPAEPEADVEAPDWLAELGGIGEVEGAPPESAAPPAGQPSAEPEPDAEEDLDWLSELDEPVEEPEPAAPPPPAEPEEPPRRTVFGASVPRPLVDAGTPDWLAHPAETDAGDEKLPPSPDWLGEFPTVDEEPTGDVESAPAPDTEPEEAIPTPSEEAPDWLDELPAAEEEPAPAPEAESEEDIPALLEEAPGVAAGEESAEAEPHREPEAGIAPEPALPESEPEDLSGIEDEGDTLDWLSELDDEKGFDLPPDETLIPAEGEDLLGLSGEFGPGESIPIEEMAAPGEEEETIAEPGAMPDWIASLQEEEAAPPEAEEAELTPEEVLAEQIADLRYERITGEPPESGDESPEPVGALKDVVGVIQPEMIFEGMELTVEAPIGERAVTGEEMSRIRLVEELLAAEAEPVPVGDVGRIGLPVIRWVVTIVLIVAVAAPLFAGQSLFTHAGAGDGVRPAYETLDALVDGPATVLAAFEYGPETAAELEPLASAVLTHLAGGEDVTVLAVSTKPTGPAMAEAVLEEPAIASRLGAEGGWANLGYIAGQARGISALALGPPPGVDSPLAADYRGEPTGIPAASLAGGDFDLVIVFTAQPEGLRAWIEQAGQPTGVPLLAGVSARTTPFAQPYVQSGQIVAVLSGVNDAVAYGALAGGSPSERAVATWNAQALGGLAAAVLIIAGGIIAGILPRSSRSERRR
jgi:hypothetical protein